MNAGDSPALFWWELRGANPDTIAKNESQGSHHSGLVANRQQASGLFSPQSCKLRQQAMLLPASYPLPIAIRQNHQAFDIQGIMCRVGPSSMPRHSAFGHFGNITGHFPAGALSNIEAASGTGLALHHDDGWPGGHTPEARKSSYRSSEGTDTAEDLGSGTKLGGRAAAH